MVAVGVRAQGPRSPNVSLAIVCFSATVDAAAEPQVVKAVVYEYFTDRIGTAVLRLR